MHNEAGISHFASARASRRRPPKRPTQPNPLLSFHKNIPGIQSSTRLGFITYSKNPGTPLLEMIREFEWATRSQSIPPNIKGTLRRQETVVPDDQKNRIKNGQNLSHFANLKLLADSKVNSFNCARTSLPSETPILVSLMYGVRQPVLWRTKSIFGR
jgi:hypothetical protein